jgi:hypothetical protein
LKLQKLSLSFKYSYHKFVCNYSLYVPHAPPISFIWPRQQF